jgi:hypothetical protein
MMLEEILAAVAPLYERLSHQERELLELKQRLAVVEAKCVIEYAGVWRAGQQYRRGNATSHDGGLWVAERETLDERPGNGATSWKLVVKSGHANGAPAPVRRVTTGLGHNGLGQVQFRPGSGPTRPRAR